MTLWMLVVSEDNNRAYATELKTNWRYGEPGHTACYTRVKHHATAIKKPAERLTAQVYHIMCREGYLNLNAIYVDYIPSKDTPVDTKGPSAQLALALGLITAICLKNYHDIAATGEVSITGGVHKIGGLKLKIRAALEKMPTGGKILFPDDNKDDVTPELHQQAINQGVSLIPVRHLYEACAAIGLELKCSSIEPFRGLAAYRYEDRQIFRGRQREINEILNHLTIQQRQHILLIHGPSGSGKTSLINAGLLPALSHRYTNINEVLLWSIVFPCDLFAGSQPLGLWQGMLTALRQPQGLGDANIDATFAVDSAETILTWLRQQLHQVAQSNKQKIRYLLIVDQLEELFTLDIPTQTQDAFINLLITLATKLDLYIILGLRDDYWPHLQTHEHLLAQIGIGSYLLNPPNTEALRDIIEQPAWLAECSYERDANGIKLTDRILQDLGQYTTALPLLSYTLHKLHENKEELPLAIAQDNAQASQQTPQSRDTATHLKIQDCFYQLTHASYEEIGRLHGAMSQMAEELCVELQTDHQSLQHISRALCSVPISGYKQPRLVALVRFMPGNKARALINKFIDYQLITCTRQSISEDQYIFAGDYVGERTQIQVTHPALLTHWERMKRRIESEESQFLLRHHLEIQAQNWQQATQHQQDLLLRGEELSKAEKLMGAWGDDLDLAIQNFIKASATASKILKQEQQNSIISYILFIGLFTIALSFLADMLHPQASLVTIFFVLAAIALGGFAAANYWLGIYRQSWQPAVILALIVLFFSGSVIVLQRLLDYFQQDVSRNNSSVVSPPNTPQSEPTNISPQITINPKVPITINTQRESKDDNKRNTVPVTPYPETIKVTPTINDFIGDKQQPSTVSPDKFPTKPTAISSKEESQVSEQRPSSYNRSERLEKF